MLIFGNKLIMFLVAYLQDLVAKVKNLVALAPVLSALNFMPCVSFMHDKMHFNKELLLGIT